MQYSDCLVSSPDPPPPSTLQGGLGMRLSDCLVPALEGEWLQGACTVYVATCTQEHYY